MATKPNAISVVERVRALETEGVLQSRNKNFELFEDKDNRRALNMKRRLDRLEDLLCQAHAEQQLGLAVATTEVADVVDLVMELPGLRAHYAARMHRDELALLLERPTLQAIFAQAGITAGAANQ